MHSPLNSFGYWTLNKYYYYYYYIISRSRAIILSMSSPLPNIIMLGDFNFPDINWLNPDYNCPDASPLILFSDCLFLNQQVSATTRKSIILDLIFCLMIL